MPPLYEKGFCALIREICEICVSKIFLTSEVLGLSTVPGSRIFLVLHRGFAFLHDLGAKYLLTCGFARALRCDASSLLPRLHRGFVAKAIALRDGACVSAPRMLPAASAEGSLVPSAGISRETKRDVDETRGPAQQAASHEPLAAQAATGGRPA
jgi:hypothetical protein